MTEVAALDGLNVVEFASGIAGPYCGWLMACLGADVIKIEGPQGDPQRHLDPPGPSGDGAGFTALNSGKRSFVPPLGLAGESELSRLVAAADLVIADEGPLAEMARDVAWIKSNVGPQTVTCWTSQAGPSLLAGELEVQGMSGILRALGQSGEAPARIGADVSQVLAGNFLFQGALAALFERDHSHLGQSVTTSGIGALAAISSIMIAAVDDPDEWNGPHCLAAGYPRDHGVPTQDGGVSLTPSRRSDEAWVAMCEELGAHELGADPSLAHESQRAPRTRQINRRLAEFTHHRSQAAVIDCVIRHGGFAVPVQTWEEVVTHPQAGAIDAFSELEPGRPTLAPPWRINNQRPHPSHGAPGLGAETEELLRLAGGERSGTA
jgi:crotonobetainyl-CoA:carnitine CoA-transferase CaiB-like acyl-CoA transferase